MVLKNPLREEEEKASDPRRGASTPPLDRERGRACIVFLEKTETFPGEFSPSPASFDKFGKFASFFSSEEIRTSSLGTPLEVLLSFRVYVDPGVSGDDVFRQFWPVRPPEGSW